MPKGDKLTDKQELFCREYLIDLNATQAAIRAGYKEKTAQQIGSQNLSKLVIQEKIQELLKQRSDRVEFTSDEVLKKLSILARSNINKFVKPDGHGGLIMHIQDDISEDDMYCISEVTTEEYQDPAKGDPVKRTKIKFVDKLKSIELAGKHVDVGAFKEKVETEHNINHNIDNSELAKQILFTLAKGKSK